MKTQISPFHSLFPFKIIHTNAYSHKHIFVRLSVLTKNNDIQNIEYVYCILLRLLLYHKGDQCRQQWTVYHHQGWNFKNYHTQKCLLAFFFIYRSISLYQECLFQIKPTFFYEKKVHSKFFQHPFYDFNFKKSFYYLPCQTPRISLQLLAIENSALELCFKILIIGTRKFHP